MTKICDEQLSSRQVQKSIEEGTESFCTFADKLHECTQRLFEGTPYSPEKWPEIWLCQIELLKPYIDEDLYNHLVADETGAIDLQALPPRFVEKLNIFKQEFVSLIPAMLTEIESMRKLLPVGNAKSYTDNHVSRYFSKVLISRPRQVPFLEYDFGVGLTDEDASPKKANRNGRDTQRVHYLTTELVLMISVMMRISKHKVFLALFPSKAKKNIVDEWQALRMLSLTYYFSLYRYATMEAIFDDLVVLFGCYEIFTKTAHLKRDSEKFIIFFISVARKALSHRRFWEHVEKIVGPEKEEVKIQFVLNHLLKPRKGNTRLVTIFMRNMQTIDTTIFAHISRLESQISFTPQCDYPRQLLIGG